MNKPTFGPKALKPEELTDLSNTTQKNDNHSKAAYQTLTRSIEKTQTELKVLSKMLQEDSEVSEPEEVQVKSEEPTQPIQSIENKPAVKPDKLTEPVESKPKVKQHYLHNLFQLQSPRAWLLYYTMAIIGFFLFKSIDLFMTAFSALLFPFSILLIENLTIKWHKKPYQLCRLLWRLTIKSYGLAIILFPLYGMWLMFYFVMLYGLSPVIGLAGLIYVLVHIFKK